ncbi:nitrate- and nitrite sensing domain-containing protein [Nonomuraea turcica]|uniref:nitrate- and nitrite sensing domain-containing protein n=1 Tax=Nonomuraea sp. G32 TaxID=3067274 RepID=UPI00273BC236|nr:nitrate- and nitrite sensing domain-containing protein [Nonomuraea sp. G32]MDP4504617.1 nitrate- and nitrite sensing domain-containing protein [Nonomuraea sp. G32]
MSTELGQRQASEGNWRLRNWRVRARLVALILIPTAAAVLLGGIQVLASTAAAGDFARTNQFAQLSQELGALTHAVSGERARTAWYIARNRPADGLADVRAQMTEVDSAATDVRGIARRLTSEVTGRTEDQLEQLLNRLDDLTALRKQALDANLLPAPAVELYTTVINDLLSVHNELIKGSADDELFRQTRMLDALARAKESVSYQQALVTVVLVEGAFDQDQLKRFLGEQSKETNERKGFAAEATAEERRFFDETVNGNTAERMLFLRELVLIRATNGLPLRGLDLGKRDDAKEWYEASNVVVDSMRKVEDRQAQGIVARSEALSADERQRAFVTAGAVLALMVAVLLITTGVARSLVRPLRRLRGEALEIAGKRLPAFVQHVRESRDGAVDAEVPPIGIFSKDEVGELARAFDEVHREAVRLAGDEARLRANVNAMFVNLSRRSQTLVERQLTLIEKLERGERDDARLGDLFKLDHLATRMRRNSENLLVLAGQEAARKWSEPVELMDIVRAALGEVESYDRVSIQIQSDVAIAGQAVTDAVHLLAELIENAVSFSSRDTKVIISSSRIDGGSLMLSVTDNGIGMTQEELGEANWRLANPPVVDVSVSRRMGLFVVGRLALRHNIRVQLRRQDIGGLTAMVLIPPMLLTDVPGTMPAMQPSAAHSPAAQPHTMQPPARQPFGSQPSFGSPSFGSEPFTSEQQPFASEAFTSEPFGSQSFASEPFGSQSFGSEPFGSGFQRDMEVPRQGQPAMPPYGPGHPSFDVAPPAPEPSSWFSSPHTSSGSATVEPPPDVTTPPATYPSFATPASSKDEFLPIFASVEDSSWFTKSAPTADRRDPAWSSPADQGWQAAGAAEEPAQSGTTNSGLPKRTPRANLVPGTANPKPPPASAPPLSPDRLRNRLASYQQGVRKGRSELEEDS